MIQRKWTLNVLSEYGWLTLSVQSDTHQLCLILTNIIANPLPDACFVFVFLAPAIFPMLFGIVKPMMAEKTLQKINVLGSELVV